MLLVLTLILTLILMLRRVMVMAMAMVMGTFALEAGTSCLVPRGAHTRTEAVVI